MGAKVVQAETAPAPASASRLLRGSQAPDGLWPSRQPEMGAWALLMALFVAVAQAQVCSVDKNVFEVKENTIPSGPLVNISVPKDQQVTLGPLSTLFAFRIQGTQLFLNVTPDYEENTMLQAQLECRRGDTVVTQLRVFVTVLDINDNPPVFPFVVKTEKVPEDTKVNTIVIPETKLEAHDLDKDDILFYTLQEVTPGAGNFFSLVGTNRPALRLDRSLDFNKWQNMSFRLVVRDTREEGTVPSHTATATLVLEVQPADLRPPWFLPCVYSDPHICVPAQYRGAIPTGHKLPTPLTLRPGPIYAVDGDWGINQPIIYSIIKGQEDEDGTFIINDNSGNLTMTRSVPRPKTFRLFVKGEQKDHARYSVTQVTVEARDASGSLPHFPESLYRGTVAVGSGVGVAVKDAADPAQPLRIQAQDSEFPDLNSAITYQITNNSHFRMNGEVVLTAARLLQAGVFYAEVEANNTVTSGTTTTVVEIQVSEQEPTPTGPPGSPTPPEAGRTTRPSSSSTSEVPKPSQGPPTTSSLGITGPQPPSGSSTLEPPQTLKPSQGPSTTISGGSTSPQPPSGSSTSGRPQTSKPSQGPSTTSSGGITGPQPPSGSSTLEPPRTLKPSQGPSTTSSGGSTGPQPPSGSSTSGPTRTSKPSQGPSTISSGGSTGPPPHSGTTWRPLVSSTPGGPSSAGTSTSSSASPSASSAQTPKPGTSHTMPHGPSDSDDQRFSAAEMGALGGVLSALLLLTLIALGILLHKHYGLRPKCCSGKAPEPEPCGFDNKAFLADHEANWAPAPSPSPGGAQAEVPPAPLSPAPPAPAAPAAHGRVPESPAAARDEGGSAGVRSILTKERRPEGGYKAVWFGENIAAETDVVVLNAPTSETDVSSDSGSEGSGDEGASAGPGGAPHDDAPSADSTYI